MDTVIIIGVLLLVGALIGLVVFHFTSKSGKSPTPPSSKCPVGKNNQECSGNGTCQAPSTGVSMGDSGASGYSCLCNPGYSGADCSKQTCGAFDDKDPSSFAGSVCSSQANYDACTKGQTDAPSYKDKCCASGTGSSLKVHACVSKDAWDACKSTSWSGKHDTYDAACCAGINDWKAGDATRYPSDCCTGDNQNLPYCKNPPKCGAFDDTNPSSFAGSVCSSQTNYGVCTKDQKDAPAYKDACCASGTGSSLKVHACVSQDAWDACKSTSWDGKPATYDIACCGGIQDWKAGDATRYPSDCCTGDNQNLPYCKNPPK